MRKKGLAINPHALAKYAGIACKSVYNHPDLLEQIRAETIKPTPRPAAAAPEPANESSIVTALRKWASPGIVKASFCRAESVPKRCGRTRSRPRV